MENTEDKMTELRLMYQLYQQMQMDKPVLIIEKRFSHWMKKTMSYCVVQKICIFTKITQKN